MLPNMQLSLDVVLTCTSDSNDIVIAILLIYKSIYLWVGLFLAFETRKVNIEALNDARFIALAVYCSVLTCIPLVPIGILLSQQPQARYGVLAGGIFFTITVILCLLFIPKVRNKRVYLSFGCLEVHGCALSEGIPQVYAIIASNVVYMK